LPGEALSALVSDYLEDTADWDGKKTGELPAERFKNAFMLARKFVLPMNPPRAELDSGLKLLFSRHGVIIKKTRFPRRLPPKSAVTE
jgi:poly(A) polymerase